MTFNWMLLHVASRKSYSSISILLREKVKNPHSNTHGKCTQSSETGLIYYFHSFIINPFQDFSVNYIYVSDINVLIKDFNHKSKQC